MGRPTTRACSKRTSRRRSRIAAGRAGSSSRRKKKTSTSRCRRSAARRRTCAGWRSSWPRRPTSSRWRTWRSTACSKARRSTPAPCCCSAPADAEAADADELEVVASRSDSPHRYHRVSQFLATTVMREGQAVLARNVMDDSQLGSRDSKGEILATSVICAPIRRDGKVLGVIHLYSTDAGKRDRSRRSGIHAGRGRYRGRRAGEPQPAAGAGRESEPDSRRKRAASRAARRAERNRRRQRGDEPGRAAKSPGPRRAGRPC